MKTVNIIFKIILLLTVTLLLGYAEFQILAVIFPVEYVGLYEGIIFIITNPETILFFTSHNPIWNSILLLLVAGNFALWVFLSYKIITYRISESPAEKKSMDKRERIELRNIIMNMMKEKTPKQEIYTSLTPHWSKKEIDIAFLSFQ